MSNPWLIIGKVAYLYTDSFLIISGLLTAYTLSRSSPIKSVVARYIRYEYSKVILRRKSYIFFKLNVVLIIITPQFGYNRSNVLLIVFDLVRRRDRQ